MSGITVGTLTGAAIVGVSAGLLLIPNALDRSPVCGLGTWWQQAHLKEIQMRKGLSALTHRQ